MRLIQPLLPNRLPHLPVAYPVSTDEALTTESQRDNLQQGRRKCRHTQSVQRLLRYQLYHWTTILLASNQLTPWHQNLKVHHRIHKSPPPVPILSQVDPIYTPPANVPKIHSDPIYALVFQVVSFLLAFPSKPCTHSSPMHATCPAHLILLDLI
jgi:hypothetical protein